jgi:hypothetical protein
MHGSLGQLQSQGFVLQFAGAVEEEVDANTIRSLNKHRVYGQISVVYGANPKFQSWISGPPAGQEI